MLEHFINEQTLYATNKFFNKKFQRKRTSISKEARRMRKMIRHGDNYKIKAKNVIEENKNFKCLRRKQEKH